MAPAAEDQEMLQSDVTERFENEIPAALREQFSHLSFSEMADRPECADYADELNEMERDWFGADDA